MSPIGYFIKGIIQGGAKEVPEGMAHTVSVIFFRDGTARVEYSVATPSGFVYDTNEVDWDAGLDEVTPGYKAEFLSRLSGIVQSSVDPYEPRRLFTLAREKFGL